MKAYKKALSSWVNFHPDHPGTWLVLEITSFFGVDGSMYKSSGALGPDFGSWMSYVSSDLLMNTHC